MDMADVLRLTARTTVARIMERDDFSTRFAEGSPIALSELLYPLLQATDSVEVRADVELGGHRPAVQHPDGPPPPVPGRPGPPGRADDAAARGARRRPEDVEVARQLHRDRRAARGAVRQADEHPGRPDAPVLPADHRLAARPGRGDARGPAHRRARRRSRPSACSARTVVDLYHGAGAGEQAEAEFDRVFKDHAVPTDVEEREVAGVGAADPVVPAAWRSLGLATSNKDARRKIEQGAVRLDQEKVTDPDGEVAAGGRRRPADLGGQARLGEGAGAGTDALAQRDGQDDQADDRARRAGSRRRPRPRVLAPLPAPPMPIVSRMAPCSSCIRRCLSVLVPAFGRCWECCGFRGFLPLLPTGRQGSPGGPPRRLPVVTSVRPHPARAAPGRLDGAASQYIVLPSPPTGASHGFARRIDTDAPRSSRPLAVSIRPLRRSRSPETGIHSRGWVSARLALDRDGREAASVGQRLLENGTVMHKSQCGRDAFGSGPSRDRR